MAEPYNEAYTIIPTQESILQRARDAATSGLIRGATVFDGQLLDGKRAPTDADGVIKPYMAIVFPAPGKGSYATGGIVGASQDLQTWRFGIELYTAGPGELRDFMARVSYLFRGWEPVGAGELELLNSGEIENPADLKQNHARIGIGLIFSCYVGTKTPNLTA